MAALPHLTATRYLQPLREGGSLPAVVDTDGGGLFVLKFRGAGQGPRALVAEILVAGIARVLGLPVPELALVDVSPAFGRSEPDPEIQDVLRRSEGVNVGLRYLDGAFNFQLHAAGNLVPDELATRLVWLDALVTNVDRTPRNPNLMVWQRQVFLIDHGAALYAHHDWSSVDEVRTRTAFPLIKDHVLLGKASQLAGEDEALAAALSEGVLAGVVAQVPDELLAEQGDVAQVRGRYLAYLRDRVAAPRAFVAEAMAARERRLAAPAQRTERRR
jgi:hypothetical protein